MVYKAFALFNDSRFPVEYQGNSPDLIDGTDIMMTLINQYDTLFVEARTLIYPYLLPPYMDGSWGMTIRPASFRLPPMN